MKTTTDYTFEVSLSTKAFDHKPDKIREVPFLSFNKKTVDVTGFLEHMFEGYCYAPIFALDSFGMKQKNYNNNFISHKSCFAGSSLWFFVVSFL